MMFIGICGASGSGKSTLAESLYEKLDGNCVLIQQDAYYSNHPDLTLQERAKLNYDEPGIFDHDSLLADVQDLMKGKVITKKQYDFSQHLRCDSDEIIEPKPVVIVEGIHAFYDERLRNEMGLKIYVKVDPDICLLRRIQRDIVERGRDINSVSLQYLTTVKPMYEKYIRYYEQYADIIVAGGGKNTTIAEMIAVWTKTAQK